MSQDFDAILIVSFGGPEGMDDVMPFLENVLRGRDVPRERMLEVAEHYESFGGVSPINGQVRALIAALEDELARHPHLQRPIYWGNRNWHPMLEDTLRQMRDDGVTRALAFVTSSFSSYSGCRQYREDIARAREAVGEGAPEVEKLRTYFNHPTFVEANTECVHEALEDFEADARPDVRLVFTAHSIPLSMAKSCDYEVQLQEVSRLIAERLGHTDFDLVYQSRSGPPHVPWLEPDVCDHLEALAARGVDAVLVHPLGFQSDHMEVLYDLDTEARQVAEALDMTYVRSPTVGVRPTFIRAVRELLAERLTPGSGRPAVGDLPARPDRCAPGCCAPGGRPGRPATA